MKASSEKSLDCGDMSPLSSGRHVGQNQSNDLPEHSKNKPWTHAPPHWTYEPGVYFVTASTLEHLPTFKGTVMLDFLETTILECLAEGGWKLQAWAIFPNHYHFMASHGRDAKALSKIIGKIHMLTAKQANLRDKTPGRKVWFNYRDTQLTFEKSWLARLAYVIGNPVKHGLVLRAEQYRWCSAGWFVKNTSRAFHQTVISFKTDQVTVEDPYQVDPSDCFELTELSKEPTCRPMQSGDMSPQSKPNPTA